jgi:hypothetical protein
MSVGVICVTLWCVVKQTLAGAVFLEGVYDHFEMYNDTYRENTASYGIAGLWANKANKHAAASLYPAGMSAINVWITLRDCSFYDNNGGSFVSDIRSYEEEPHLSFC